MSETVADETNRHTTLPDHTAAPHRLDNLASRSDDSRLGPPVPISGALTSTQPTSHAALAELDHIAPPSNTPLPRPVTHTDVYVDDFVQLAQGPQQ